MYKECGCSSEDKDKICEVCGKPADECTCNKEEEGEKGVEGEEKGVEGE